MLVCDLGHRFDVENVTARIADGLTVQELRLVPNRALPGIEIVGIDEGEIHRELSQEVLELSDRAPVERARGDDVIAGPEQCEQGRGLGGQATGKADRTDALLEIGYPLLEGCHRGIHDPGIRVAVFLKVEVCGSRFRILENVARGLEDGNGPGAGVRIGSLTRVHRAGLQTEVVRLDRFLG